MGAPWFTTISNTFLTLTDKDGNRIAVNVQHLSVITEKGDGALIRLDGGAGSLVVQQSYDEVLRALSRPSEL